METARTVVIIDDHEMIRAGLISRLKDHWQITGEAVSLDEAVNLFANSDEWPNLIILDIELGNDWGLDLLGILRKNTSNGKKIPPVLIYSVYDDYVHINAALRAGVKGYVSKSQNTDDLLEAMEKAVDGKMIFPSSLAQRVTVVSELLLCLTKREREIFDMVQRRFNNREIAGTLGVSLRTVENNLGIIYSKTGVKNRQALEKL